MSVPLLSVRYTHDTVVPTLLQREGHLPLLLHNRVCFIFCCPYVPRVQVGFCSFSNSVSLPRVHTSKFISTCPSNSSPKLRETYGTILIVYCSFEFSWISRKGDYSSFLYFKTSNKRVSKGTYPWDRMDITQNNNFSQHLNGRLLMSLCNTFSFQDSQAKEFSKVVSNDI